jgi:transposase-like protein
MYLHANAKLGLSGRSALVCAIEGGLWLRAAAAAFSVSPATAHRWWHRWLAGEPSKAAPGDRSSRPHRCPRRLTAAEEVLRARRETNLGPSAAGRDHPPRPLDDLEGARPARALPPPARGAASVSPLRVVAAGCAAAHGREEARSLRQARPLRER